MAGFTYVAQKSLLPGHMAGELYSVGIRMIAVNLNKPRVLTPNESMDGSIEQIFYNSKRTWQFTSRPYTIEELAAIEEFLDSVEAGETFSFDPYGTAVSPHQARTGVRADQGYAPARALRQAGRGERDLFSVSFSVREL